MAGVKKKSNAGRPTLRTPEVIQKIEEVAALDGSVEEMAAFAGIHRETIYAWMREDKAFSDRIAELREYPVLKARRTIVKALEDPDIAMKYVERKRKKEFSLRQEHTGADGEPISFGVVSYAENINPTPLPAAPVPAALTEGT